MTSGPATRACPPTTWRTNRPWWAMSLRLSCAVARQAPQEHESSSAILLCTSLNPRNASMRAFGIMRLSTVPSGPMANTASPSSSWISRGGARRCITASSSAPVISAPCWSSVAVTNAVNPEMSARIRNPSSLMSQAKTPDGCPGETRARTPSAAFLPAGADPALVLDGHPAVLDHPGPERLGGDDVLDALAIPDDEVGAAALNDAVVGQAQDPRGVDRQAVDERTQVLGWPHVRRHRGQERHVGEIGGAHGRAGITHVVGAERDRHVGRQQPADRREPAGRIDVVVPAHEGEGGGRQRDDADAGLCQGLGQLLLLDGRQRRGFAQMAHGDAAPPARPMRAIDHLADVHVRRLVEEVDVEVDVDVEGLSEPEDDVDVLIGVAVVVGDGPYRR